jgi:hypothetical protein
MAVLDRLLPAVDELPGAGGLGLADAITQDPLAHQRPDHVAAFLARLPTDFAACDTDERDRVLGEIERELPEAFETLINLVYNAYYLDPRVLGRIERLTGYRARAPQPLGYTVEALDQRLLAPVRGRPPQWRPDELPPTGRSTDTGAKSAAEQQAAHPAG